MQAKRRARAAPRPALRPASRRPARALDGFAFVYAQLARYGFRTTQQRRAIIGCLARARRYVTANELYRRLAPRPAAGLATVYRTLEMLKRIGAASAAVAASGETAYLFCPVEHHHHAICTRCGRVDDVPCRSQATFARMLVSRPRFTLVQHRLELLGLCARCA
jgi:Fur family ferric uptake transcriptional regulator